jgi:tryptophanyl-tRNA synthetase
VLAPVREKYFAYLDDKKYLDEILLKGKLKAEKQAKATLDRVYNKLGLIR